MEYMHSFWCVVNIALLASRNITPHQNSYTYFHIQPIAYNYYYLPQILRQNFTRNMQPHVVVGAL